MMLQALEGLNQRIKSIRKSMQMSLHDCAKILGTTTKRYLAFEQGEESLTLPEMEILAYYFGVPLMDCLQGHLQFTNRFSLLDDSKRMTYIHLREKWIRSRLALAMKEMGIDPDNTTEGLEIQPNILERYNEGDTPISLENLEIICDYFEIPLDELFPEINLNELDNPDIRKKVSSQWNPEFPLGKHAKDRNEEAYAQLLAALKEIPEEDQAQIARTLLDKLKSI